MTAGDNPAVTVEEGSKNTRRRNGRIIFTAGMGFFTDAYDLFIIGVVTTILAPIWHLSVTQLAVLNGASLAAAAFGAVFFGTMSDRLGRKKLYGIEILILFFGAIFGACSPNFTWLLVARIIVGLGIGGDYPSSAVVASESSNRKNRGFLVLLVFAMQALGLIFGPLFATALLASHIKAGIVWRVLLSFGAIPAACVFYLRRKVQETSHFLRSKQTPVEVSRVISDLADVKEPVQGGYKKQKLSSPRWLKYLIGTAGAWFLLDVAFYGNGVSSVMIINHINPSSDLLMHTLISAVIFIIFAAPGYWAAAKYIDKIGRKPLQILGFFVMALAYLAIAFIPAVVNSLPVFILVFGLSFFFVEFGPNTTTFLIPSEIYPTSIRAKAHGISAAVGKVGAFVGAFLLPIILHSKGLHFMMALLAGVSLIGIASTLLLPEMKNLSLESLEEMTDDDGKTPSAAAQESA